MKNIATAIMLVLTPIASYAYEDQMLEMIGFIQENTTYSYQGEPLPEIRRDDADVLCQAVYLPEDYEKIKDQCAIAGYYDHYEDIIYIANEPISTMVEDGFFEVVLVHELVHYLQDINGSYETARCLRELEEDAFFIQKIYVEENGLDESLKPNPLFVIFATRCEGDIY
jgi:hypothetical protein